VSSFIDEGVHVTDRIHHIDSVQHLLTAYGCSIRTRIGLHETEKGFCSPNGLLLLEMTDEDAKADELMQKLNAVEGVEVKKMIFDHP
jgi:hypothetical protein